MRLRFLGCGDAFGSGGRMNTCFHVTTDATGFLIDCGASAMISLRRFSVDPNRIETIFISHLHGDHFGGLPFFILDAQLYSRRETPLTIAGPPGLGARLDQAMELLFPGSTTVARRFRTKVIELTPGQPARVNQVAVTPILVSHPCGAPPLALRFEAEGKVLAYTGDSQWTDALVEAGREADLLIAEALFFDKSVKWHLDYATLAAHLVEIGAKRVILTHMGPDMLARRSEIALETAEDGLEVMV
jgi:ribonuclease BN (tRNA processing enzyme)